MWRAHLVQREFSPHASFFRLVIIYLLVDLAGIKNIFWATITTDGRNLIYQTLILLLRALPITYFGNFPLTQGNCFWGDPISFLTRSCHAHERALFRGLVFLKCHEIFVIFYVLFCRSNTLLLFEAGDNWRLV